MNMRKQGIHGLVSLATSLQLLYSPCSSLGSPVSAIVFPRILEERSDSGELVVSIHTGRTLALRKASVLREELQVTTLEENEKTIHYMNGSRIEQNLYHDPDARAAVILTRTRGLRLVGILSPTERIEPSNGVKHGTEGGVQHHILTIAQGNSDVHNSSDVFRHGTEDSRNATPSSQQTPSKIVISRSQDSPYPVKATCETGIAIDSAYFKGFRKDKEKLLEYMAVLVAFTNLKFRTFADHILQFQIVVTEIVVFSESTEPFIKKSTQDHSVMLSETLQEFNKYIENKDMFRKTDVVVLFTGSDLAMSSGSGRPPAKIIVGLTNLAAACGERKAAIIEDMPRTFTSAHTMAHEIGHLVGSAHDGSKNPDSSVDPTKCPAQEKKIMAPGMGTYMSQEFSYCSTAQIALFILSSKGNCLLTNSTVKLTRKLTFLDVNKTRPSLDEFCQRHYTEYNETGYKPHASPKLSLSNCIITCKDPGKPRVVVVNDAPDGTSCNETRPRAICINGKCTRVKNNHVETFGDDVKSAVVLLP